ncbi:Mbeg1-like protein [Lysinibacillus halotolerans]|uniref:DUF2974 domain-containing protein n=1 Tax=Lysinibacillus halotolerans TaxID=1368476 RepID=A0A3M8HC12_9BACI|nr:Mbeg1-like protein [Lysinibacillus halotolerans]RNC99804.1 DUF2974 domain-containing protein [Lysinibacillus halotolerans]
MTKLSYEQIAVLDNLIYWDFPKSGTGTWTMERILMDMERKLNLKNFESPNMMSRDDWIKIKNIIKNDKQLMNYTMVEYRDPSQKYPELENANTSLDFYPMRVATFVDNVENPEDVNVVFRGTSSSFEWKDNLQLLYLPETLVQEMSLYYVDNVLDERYGNSIHTSGHSKGGNNAFYTALFSNRVSTAFSLDGVGVSQEIIENNRERIDEIRPYLTLVSAEEDYVNPLLNNIAGKTIYIEIEEGRDFTQNHNPSLILNEDGKFNKEVEQGELGKFFDAISNQLYTIDSHNLQRIIEYGLLDIVQPILDGKIELNRDLLTGKLLDSVSELIADADLLTFSYKYFKEEKIYNVIEDKYGSFTASIFKFIIEINPINKAVNLGIDFAEENFKGVVLSILSVVDAVTWIIKAYETAKEITENYINILTKSAEVLKERITSTIQNFINTGKALKKATVNFLKQVINSVNLLISNTLKKIFTSFIGTNNEAKATPYINLNTNSLRNYADRLEKVKSRLAELDSDMTSLIFTESLPAVISAIRANNFPSQRKIQKCINYLDGTAEAFERAERNILNRV